MNIKQISFTTLVFLFDSDCFLLTKTLFGFFTAVTWNYTCPCLDNLNLFKEETDNCKICVFAKLCCEKVCYATNHTFPTRERIKRKRLKNLKEVCKFSETLAFISAYYRWYLVLFCRSAHNWRKSRVCNIGWFP